MPRAQPGQRFGGRTKGIPNKATIERALLAARQVEEAKANAKKLAKEVLEDFMLLTAGMAAHFQEAPPGHPPNPHADPDKFWRCAQAAIDCAHKLAPYQSPTFRAIVVAPAPDPGNEPERRKRFGLMVFEGGRALIPPPAA